MTWMHENQVRSLLLPIRCGLFVLLVIPTRKSSQSHKRGNSITSFKRSLSSSEKIWANFLIVFDEENCFATIHSRLNGLYYTGSDKQYLRSSVPASLCWRPIFPVILKNETASKSIKNAICIVNSMAFRSLLPWKDDKAATKTRGILRCPPCIETRIPQLTLLPMFYAVSTRSGDRSKHKDALTIGHGGPINYSKVSPWNELENVRRKLVDYFLYVFRDPSRLLSSKNWWLNLICSSWAELEWAGCTVSPTPSSCFISTQI